MKINKKFLERIKALDLDLDEVQHEIMINLHSLNKNKSFTIKHIADRSEYVEVPISVSGTEQYTNEDVDSVDVINFALWMYLLYIAPQCWKSLLHSELDQEVYFDLLNQFGIEIQATLNDKPKDRFYAYTQCPHCGADGFFFSWDQRSQNIFMGCYDPGCEYHQTMDIVNFIMKQYQLKYSYAVISVIDMLIKAKARRKPDAFIEKEGQILQCDIKENASFCFVVLSVEDLQAVKQVFPNESAIWIDNGMLTKMNQIIVNTIPLNQLVVVLCDSLQKEAIDELMQRFGVKKQGPYVMGLAENRRKSKLMALTVFKVLNEELKTLQEVG